MIITKMLLKTYRDLPFFKGKSWLGKKIFKRFINIKMPVEFIAHKNIFYRIPNTIEPIGVELLTNGIYSCKVIRFLNERIKPGDNYFDIGANIGAVGLPVIKNKPEIKYLGFEASPKIFDYLRYNFQKNSISNYQLHNYVVHDQNKQLVKFYEHPYHSRSSLAPGLSNNFTLLNSISLDSFCNRENILRINWIKVDVQGFEINVFRGLQNLLSARQVENILFEFEPWEEEGAGMRVGISQQYLKDIGYDLFDIEGNKLSDILTKKRTMIWAKPSFA